jgi:ABC-type Fe3+-hydroxamate transport system substrate-binding protein
VGYPLPTTYPPGMRPGAADDPRRNPARTAALTGLVSNAGGRGRPFVDATGVSVALPPVIRRLVATDADVGALLREVGATIVGCAGMLDEVEPVGAPRAPDPAAVAALRPDVIVAGAVGRAYDLSEPRLVEALWRVAPVVAVDTGRPAAAMADLRALIGPVVERRVAPPASDRPPGPPGMRPRLG